MSESAESTPAAKQFTGQRDSEQVIAVTRQFPIVLRMQLIIGGVIIIGSMLPALVWPLSSVAWNMIWLGVLVLAVYWFWAWVGWFYSVYILTSDRIMEIRQRGLFDRKVTQIELHKIQNVNYRIKGLTAVLFKFGDITVQTFSGTGDINLRVIHNPAMLHEQILEAVRLSGESGNYSSPGVN